MVGVEGAHDRWQISVLWCCCGHWETSGCMCDSPRPCALLATCTVCLLPHTGLYFRKTSAINPSICASMTFHLCACESVCVLQMNTCLCGWLEITNMRRVRFRGAKCFLRIKLQRDKSWWPTRFSFPPCVDDPLCPDSVVLTACLCSFCHTKATSFGNCTQLSHSTQCKTGTVCSIADEYGYS